MRASKLKAKVAHDVALAFSRPGPTESQRYNNKSSLIWIVLITLFLTCTSCTFHVPKEALTLSPESLRLRNLQTRKFETTDERRLLIAAAGLLQDLGYQIDESEVPLGVIVASKQADASDGAQIAGAIAIGILLGTKVTVDNEQKIRVSIVTRPVNRKEIALRVTFQRTVWNNEGHVSRTESVIDQELYQDFFSKLSKAVFLEAQQI